MPLSEQEQRLLDEMERHLMGHDADVVSAPQDGRTISYRNVVYGAILVLVGLGGLIAGVSIPLVAVGVIGFIAMLAGVMLAVTPVRSAAKSPSDLPGPAKKPGPSSAPSSSFMDRMNDRWDKRQGER